MLQETWYYVDDKVLALSTPQNFVHVHNIFKLESLWSETKIKKDLGNLDMRVVALLPFYPQFLAAETSCTGAKR